VAAILLITVRCTNLAHDYCP